jgi:hypothetical protein
MTSNDKYLAITEVLQGYNFEEISKEHFSLIRSLVHEDYEDENYEDENIFKGEVKSHVDGIIEIGVKKYLENM